MKRAACLLSFSLLLAGCAHSPPLIDRVSGDRVRGDAAHVSVEGGRLDSLPLAVAHCARYGRSAQFSRSLDGRALYDCVAR